MIIHEMSFIPPKIPEVNIHGVTGFTSNAGDVEDMAKNALTLLESPKIMKEFRANALERAKLFSLERVLPQYEEIYLSVVEKSLSQKA